MTPDPTVPPHGDPLPVPTTTDLHPGTALAASLAAEATVLLVGRFLVPRMLPEVVRMRNRELFLMTLVLVCLGTAAVTAHFGLSLALGAFLAGLVLSESEYGHQAFTEVLPFRDTLASLFFVSVGMLLDVRFLVAHAALVAVSVAAIMLVKLVATALPAWVAGVPPRTSVLVGAAIV